VVCGSFDFHATHQNVGAVERDGLVNDINTAGVRVSHRTTVLRLDVQERNLGDGSLHRFRLLIESRVDGRHLDTKIHQTNLTKHKKQRFQNSPHNSHRRHDKNKGQQKREETRRARSPTACVSLHFSTSTTIAESFSSHLKSPRHKAACREETKERSNEERTMGQQGLHKHPSTSKKHRTTTNNNSVDNKQRHNNSSNNNNNTKTSLLFGNFHALPRRRRTFHALQRRTSTTNFDAMTNFDDELRRRTSMTNFDGFVRSFVWSFGCSVVVE